MSGHHPDSKTMFDSYIKVASALFFLTVLTWVAALDWVPNSWGEAGNTLHIAIGLLIAIVKAFMVFYVFMHLQFDNKFIRAFVFVPIFLFFVLTFALNVLGP
jgi:caa(3)-type oxidase subunit IV